MYSLLSLSAVSVLFIYFFYHFGLYLRGESEVAVVGISQKVREHFVALVLGKLTN